jgi:CRP-like cAMP-binding protein
MYEKWIKQLIKNPLFKNMNEEELNRIFSCMKPEIKSYQNKDLITIEGDELHNIGIVLDGQVIVGKENDAGERVIMAKFGKNGMFGEIAAYTTKRWPATVEANGRATILFFPPERVNQVCNSVCSGHKLLIENMMTIIANKAMKINQKIEILTIKSVRKKISHYLLQEKRRNGKNRFDIPLKRVELAEYLDVTRPSLSRELGRMQDEGLIYFERSHFEILDEEKLRNC